MSNTCDIEPGAASESVLVTTNFNDDLEQMSSSLEEIKKSESVGSPDERLESSNSVDSLDESNFVSCHNQDEDYMHSKEWLSKEKHVFVLSSAGKPIYSRYGNEDKFVTLFGVMQALVSFVQDQDDSLQSVHAGDTQFVFLVKNNLILVAVSKTGESTAQILVQLK